MHSPRGQVLFVGLPFFAWDSRFSRGAFCFVATELYYITEGAQYNFRPKKVKPKHGGFLVKLTPSPWRLVPNADGNTAGSNLSLLPFSHPLVLKRIFRVFVWLVLFYNLFNFSRHLSQLFPSMVKDIQIARLISPVKDNRQKWKTSRNGNLRGRRFLLWAKYCKYLYRYTQFYISHCVSHERGE